MGPYCISEPEKTEGEQIAKTINNQGPIVLTCFCLTQGHLCTSLHQFKGCSTLPQALIGKRNF